MLAPYCRTASNPGAETVRAGAADAIGELAHHLREAHAGIGADALRMHGEIDEFTAQIAGGGIGEPVGDRDVVLLQRLQCREHVLQIVVGELLAARHQRLQRHVGRLRGSLQRLVEAADRLGERLARLCAVQRRPGRAAAHGHAPLP